MQNARAKRLSPVLLKPALIKKASLEGARDMQRKKASSTGPKA
jgi:hypothetical protein